MRALRDETLASAVQSIRASLARRSGSRWTVRALRNGNLTVKATVAKVPGELAAWHGLTIPYLHVGAFVVAATGGEAMSIYLLHIDPRYKHAAHYVGFTPEEDVTRRVGEHLACGAKASPLVKAAIQAGSRVMVARTWTGETATRTRERQIKNSRHVPKYCPLCREQKRNPQQPTLPL